MDISALGTTELLRLAGGLLLLATSFALALLVGPGLVARWQWRKQQQTNKGSGQQESQDQQHRLGEIKTDRLLLVVLMMGLVTAALVFVAGYGWFISVLLGFVGTNLVATLIFQAQDKKRQKQGRTEAMAIADYVAGRLNARATLFRALEDCYREHERGHRSLALSSVQLAAVIQAVELGQDLADELEGLSRQFADIPEMAGLWGNLAVMQRAHLGAAASVEQAEDLAHSLRQMDALKDSLETELATSTMTRMAMFMLMGGFTAFLLLAYGDAIGNVLIDTLAGNIILGFAILTLYVAQLVGGWIEKMPLMRF